MLPEAHSPRHCCTTESAFLVAILTRAAFLVDLNLTSKRLEHDMSGWGGHNRCISDQKKKVSTTFHCLQPALGSAVRPSCSCGYYCGKASGVQCYVQ